MNYHNEQNQKGFTLIECTIAIALLAIVMGSLVGMQGTTVKILQFSTDKQKAAIELRSVMAQFEYIVNGRGYKSLPKAGEFVDWNSTSEPPFHNKIAIAKTEAKLSQFLISAINVSYIGDEDNKPNTDILKPFIETLDTKLTLQSIDPTIQAELSTAWTFGKETKNISETVVLMNNKPIDDLSFNLPGGGSRPNPSPNPNPTPNPNPPPS